MPIPKSILERIETFRRNLDSYLEPDYKEARVRQEFIDPLFSALGWDMNNEQGYAEAYKDVVHEDSLRIPGVGQKAPDYSFRIGGTRKFFVEAKKPSVSLKDEVVLLGRPLPRGFPRCFALITACAPTGTKGRELKSVALTVD